MTDRVFSIKEAAGYLKDRLGMSRATFDRYHRGKLKFKTISPRLQIITEGDLNSYIQSIIHEESGKSLKDTEGS